MSARMEKVREALGAAQMATVLNQPVQEQVFAAALAEVEEWEALRVDSVPARRYEAVLDRVAAAEAALNLDAREMADYARRALDEL